MELERHDLGRGAWYALALGFVPDHEAVMAALVAELPLVQEPLTIAGKTYLTPRLTSWHGDPGCAYRYSGRVFEPSPWTPGLTALRDRLEATTGVRYHTVLANLYRGGDDAMGAHADNERELGPAAPDDVLIASVSLGAERRFVLVRNKDRADRVELLLGGGSLLVMGGATQRDWRHHVPRTKRPVGPRLNLTFRLFRAAAG
ncbi:MAG: alpha-ketoglutarate-dependent dioxygenase AlkB [Deltaproteobacteria bacterium]|nr:MAG: alpha-ketoglutarate-dependent dioxygenase AlkB [Deltaproteobacteria bacterium]